MTDSFRPNARRRLALTVLTLLGGVAAWNVMPSLATEAAAVVPAPEQDLAAAAAGGASETAVIAGGCFWGVQGVFQHVKGVTGTVSGYAGGDAATARYEAIGSGHTGHAEAVRITYDPRQISYGRLLQIFFSVAHNPTELNRQGPDSGTQYRSAVFPANAEQARVARSYIAQLDKAGVFGKALATTIEPLKDFYAAEAYHQDYITRNPRQPYVVINDLPKLDELKRLFPEHYRSEPVLVDGRNALQ